MTYDQWQQEHSIKVNTILNKLSSKSAEEIANYFDYDNMVKKEPDFCGLYKDNIKCHNKEKLNCFFCGCPFFVINKEPKTSGKQTIMSYCSIGSHTAGEFYENPDENNVVRIHCDCSNCEIPHMYGFTKKMLSNYYDEMVKIDNSFSILEYVRDKQLKTKKKHN